MRSFGKPQLPHAPMRAQLFQKGCGLPLEGLPFSVDLVPFLALYSQVFVGIRFLFIQTAALFISVLLLTTGRLCLLLFTHSFFLYCIFFFSIYNAAHKVPSCGYVCL